jgi:protein subunit release factor B
LRVQTGELKAAAARHGVRVEVLETDATDEVARYASLLLTGTYAAEYLRVGLVEE